MFKWFKTIFSLGAPDAGFKTLYDFDDLHAMNGRRFTLATSIVNRMAGWKSFIAARNTVVSE